MPLHRYGLCKNRHQTKAFYGPLAPSCPITAHSEKCETVFGMRAKPLYLRIENSRPKVMKTVFEFAVPLPSVNSRSCS
jgi:hypothetical protein